MTGSWLLITVEPESRGRLRGGLFTFRGMSNERLRNEKANAYQKVIFEALSRYVCFQKERDETMIS